MLHNRELTYKARILRKNMTKEERHLWFDFLKDHSVKFQAQKVVENYIVDFYCASTKLIIEIDGDQHMRTEHAELADIARDNRLHELGFDVIRISNYEVNNNFRGVCEFLDNEIQKRQGSTPF